MVELCGARFVPGTIDAYPEEVDTPAIRLRPERMEKLLGEQIDETTTRGILERLGFGDTGDGWKVPPWRYADVQREADLIEEVARIHGLDKLPTTLPARGAAIGRLTGSQPLRRRLEDLLRDRGLLETISYSFTSPAALGRLRLPDQETARIDNPLSEDLSVMRPLLLARPARRGAPQRRPRAGGGGAVRVRARLPAGGPAGAGARGLAGRRDAGERDEAPGRASHGGGARRLADALAPGGLLRREGAP